MLPETESSYGSGDVKDAWIETFTHRKFNVFNPNPNDVDIRDIAHALACNARFNGHLSRPISVAEHSIFVSRFVSTGNRFVALLHDAAEAYLSDIPRPIKQFFPEIKLLDQRVTQVIFDKFGITGWIPEEVKMIDQRICLSEALDSRFHIEDWVIAKDLKPLDHLPHYWSPPEAEMYFISRFKELRS